MKAERLIKILILLQHGETMTTRSLASELGVSERTLHRDMDSLSAAGIPVYSERGKAGGWRLVDGWKHKLSWLKEKEIISLFLPTPEKVLSDLNLNLSTDELKQKLLLTVPDHVRKNASKLWERIYIDTNTWRDSQETIKFMEAIQHAVMEDQKLTIQYKKATNEVKIYKINPLGLVAKGSKWYVVAINRQEEYRNYKLSRIIDITFLEEHFIRPSDFVLTEYWKDSKQKFIKNLPEYQVKVEVSQKIIDQIMFTGRFMSVLNDTYEQLNGEWVQASLNFPTEEEAILFILGFGNRIEVISPNYLQSILTVKANEIIELYRR